MESYQIWFILIGHKFFVLHVEISNNNQWEASLLQVITNAKFKFPNFKRNEN